MVRDRAGQGSNAPGGGLASACSSVLGDTLKGVLDLLLPRSCVSCDCPLSAHDNGIVCGVCWSRLPSLPAPQCNRCGHPLRTAVCQWCTLLPPFVRAVRSVCWMPVEPASAIVHALKYAGWTKVAEGMGERMSRLAWPQDVAEERAALVPIPLSAARKRERGYNQSELLANALSSRWRVPVLASVVARSRATRSQTELTPEQRVGNVAGSFQLVEQGRDRIGGGHIVLVDDVVTTAATLNECARVLYDGGARIISYVTFGRARASGDRL